MLPMTTTCHDSLISFEGLKGEQVSLAVPFRSPFLAESRVRRTMRMARKLETPAMLSKSVCPTARAISIPTSHREAHGSSGHETEIWTLWSLNATIQYSWKLSKKYYDDMCVCMNTYIYIFTHYD